ncbi:2-aminoethanethiol dioxygenase [Rhineura floridana]|uniref:2-aminoethanethiol dioxygenase n=1 Tax=Rhineura floridana TaxID=261503 RepID=UPI002AC80D8D|nr:2-aminoethanethiol dioxygenase [Rhineura floridana]
MSLCVLKKKTTENVDRQPWREGRQLQPPECIEGEKERGGSGKARLRRVRTTSLHPLLGGGGGGGGTMPRDNMASLIQRVARQARVTFRPPGVNNNSSVGGGETGSDGPRFVENLHRLQQLLNEVRAEDLRLAPRGPSAVPGLVQPPVSYMHICETESFSMGVFVLRAGACIPLHDHPGMNGLLKVLYGTLRIACFDTLLGAPAADGDGGGSTTTTSGSSSTVAPPKPGSSRRRHRALLRSHQLYTPASPPCLLSPHTDNLHQIDAVGGPAAFLDILAPPYDPEHGRDCHYYRLLDGQSLPPPVADPQGLPKEVWLLETPQAADFWCGGEPYPGPQVSP